MHHQTPISGFFFFPLLIALLLTEGATAQQELYKLTVSNASVPQAFGWSVALDGNHAVIGAPGNSNAISEAFVFDVTTGQQVVSFSSPVGGLLGHSVAIENDTVLVGAPFGLPPVAAVAFDAPTGLELLVLSAIGAEPSDFFGQSVAISGTLALVGAINDDDNGPSSGAVYVFDLTTGQELFKLTASNAEPQDRFGWAVAIEGDRAIVGALASRFAYVFDPVTGMELYKVTASDATETSGFGVSVAMSEGRAIVGGSRSHGVVNQAGAAYVYDVPTGDLIWKLVASDGASHDGFGKSVAMEGGRAVVGGDESAYVFDLTTGQELFKLTPADTEPDDGFGRSVAIRGDRVVVGAPFDDDPTTHSGSAYIFSIPQDPGTGFCPGDGSGSSCPCANGSNRGQGCANSSGAGSLLAAGGSGSSSTDDLVFDAALLPGVPAMLFVGNLPIEGGSGLPFGDGLRCVGGSVGRLGLMTANAAGVTSWGPGLGAAGFWSAGEWRYFQTWYRDPSGPCGSGFNMTNAVGVAFGP